LTVDPLGLELSHLLYARTRAELYSGAGVAGSTSARNLRRRPGKLGAVPRWHCRYLRAVSGRIIGATDGGREVAGRLTLAESLLTAIRWPRGSPQRLTVDDLDRPPPG
jgi:hypothetical protein